MIIEKRRNPYDYANPVKDSRIFAGRGAELSKVSYMLDQIDLTRPSSYLAIVGERASGKTSLLNMINIMAIHKEILPVRIDLVPGDGEPVTFFSKLFEELVSAAAEKGRMSTISGTPITARTIRRIISGEFQDEHFPLEFPESLNQAAHGGRISESALRADLSYLASRIARPILFLIDEAQELATNEATLSIMRTIGMRVNGYGFILAATADLVEKINSVFSPIIRQFQVMKVERFTESSEVRECIESPLATLGFNFDDSFENDDEQLFDLMRLTDGNPYEIQLLCHTMFTRWQEGKTAKMQITTEALEGVRALLESHQGTQSRPLIGKSHKLPARRLSALNLLCSAIGAATYEDIWFINNISLVPEFSRDELSEHLDGLIFDGFIEILPDGYINFTGDQFDRIYIKVLSRSLLARAEKSHALSTNSMHFLLTYYLEVFIHSLKINNASCLETCCPMMEQDDVLSAISALSALDPGIERIPGVVVFLHGAIVDAGIPRELELTTIQCQYKGEVATRWLFKRTDDPFDLDEDTRFRTVCRRLEELGGSLTLQASTLPIDSFQELLSWAKSVLSKTNLEHMAKHHITAGYNAYEKSEYSLSLEHMHRAQWLTPTWRGANNLAYMAMTAGSFSDALIYAEEAIELGSDADSLSLSWYNKAMALLASERAIDAKEALLEAQRKAAEVNESELNFGYLVVPKIVDKSIVLREVSNANLASSITNSAEIIELSIRIPSLLDGIRLVFD
ncbi:nSTAND1 domain-containing NTPase [Streptosporangium sp. V21-05]|uniref:nSTAND1 domain-containing NTPase n=1 Tax=Streptosporangium sp. V21-05 TaxID=3446115 RepID=UPI003F539A78